MSSGFLKIGLLKVTHLFLYNISGIYLWSADFPLIKTSHKMANLCFFNLFFLPLDFITTPFYNYITFYEIGRERERESTISFYLF